jgi:hypothetical protein
MLTALEAAIAAGRKEPSVMLRPGQPPFSEVGTELKGYGFKVCGRGF